MVRCACSMQFPATSTHRNSKTKPPDPVLGIGRSPKMHTFSGDRSFPNTGGPGGSAQTLSLDNFSGHRPGCRGLSLPSSSGVGVTTIVYADRLKHAIGTLENPDDGPPRGC